MIDSNNQFKKLSADLVAAARSIMEKKINKHGHDAVGHENDDIDNDGDVDASDKYLHNRRKAIAKNMKKEEVQIDELSQDKVMAYRAAARKQGSGVDKGPRQAGYNLAGRKVNPGLSAAQGRGVRVAATEEVEHINELSRKTLASYVDKASQSAADHGYHYGRKKAEADEVDRMMNRHMSFSDKDKVRDVMKTTTKDVEAPHRKAGRRLQGITRAASRLAKEEVEQIDEALNAANRYGDHHTAIKSLLKSISQHVENHKTDAHKHKDYRGKKGVHWGHVGDLAQVHSQLADIHDRLAQQGEYKKSMSESVEDLDIEQIDELSKATLGAYIDKAATDVHNNAYRAGKHEGSTGGYDAKKLVKSMTRQVGISKAAKKLAKEEVEDLEELSKATMASYVKKAADDFQKRKPKMGYDGQLKKMQNRKVGVNRALDKMYGEEVELDEAPVDGVAAGSMENGGHLCATKVFHKEWAEGTPIFSQHAKPDAYGNIAWYDVMFEHGIEKRVMIEDLEILMSESHGNHKRKMKEDVELDEARGRPRKNPLPAGKESEEPEPRQHIIQQLQRAKLSMRGGEHVTFKDGTKHHVHGQHAAKLLGKYSDMKPYEKEAFQKKIGQSHANLKSEL